MRSSRIVLLLPVLEKHKKKYDDYTDRSTSEKPTNISMNNSHSLANDYVTALPTYGGNRVVRSYSDEVKLGDLQHHVFIFKLYNAPTKQYRAFCGGSIIGEQKVISSANCFFTNRKRIRVPIKIIRIAAGILVTIAIEVDDHAEQQWRNIDKIYSQRFYKFPANDLAVLRTKRPFVFNNLVNKIPYASKNYDYDGVCVTTVLRATESWAEKKTLFSEQLQMITRRDCEKTLLKSCRLFYCTAYKSRYIPAEVEGGGLVCHGTTDSEEKDRGVLVGVTSLINVHLPTLHHRVSIFNSWINNEGTALPPSKMAKSLCLYFLLLIKLL